MQMWSLKSPLNSHLQLESQPGTGTKSSWSLKDEVKFLNFLLDHRVNGTDRDMFKGWVLGKAAIVLNQELSKGAAKNENSCRNKWRSVHFINALEYAI